MRESLQNRCENFVENRNRIQKNFAWESAYLYPVCAAIFMEKGRLVEEETLRHCRDVLKEETSLFSQFRSTVRLVMISQMAVDGAPESKLQRAMQVYDRLKQHFFASQYLPVASMTIAEMVSPGQYDGLAARTRRIYDGMKKEHPFLTSGEDCIFAALQALSARPEEELVSETEACYRILKGRFFSSNAVQSLSHVLALLEGTADEKCGRVMELFDILKEKGYRYGTEYELATLGVLAGIPEELSTIAEELIAVDQFLSGQKGYGFFGLGKRQRLMHAGMIVAADHIGQSEPSLLQTTARGGTISLIVAQQAALCAAIAAANAASSAATT